MMNHYDVKWREDTGQPYIVKNVTEKIKTQTKCKLVSSIQYYMYLLHNLLFWLNIHIIHMLFGIITLQYQILNLVSKA